MNIHELVAGIQRELNESVTAEKRARNEIDAVLKSARDEGRNGLTAEEDEFCEVRMARIEREQSAQKEIRARLDRAKAAEAEENEIDQGYQGGIHETAAAVKRNGGMLKYDQVMRIGDEPRTYSRDKDPEAKGLAFITDVANAYRGNPQANERLARHMREWAVDNPRWQERAAGDTTSAAFPNLIMPSYLIAEYASKPTSARPFADLCRHVNLPDEGMKVELAKGNTNVTAALQTSELVAVAGGNHDDDPLELSVQTAESWALVSRQSLERGRATEQIVLDDMLSQMDALIDNTLLTQATTGLFDVATRIDASGTANDWPTLYPLILQAASKVQQVLLNKGKPTHVIMHPRRWYHAESVLGTSWPLINQNGVPAQSYGTSTANGYNQGLAGRLPAGLDVVMDNNVQTQALATAQTGGTQDVMYVVSAPNCVLLEPPNRQVMIRAEAPAANQLAVMLVVYEYFSYTFQQFPAGAAYKINGVATVAPTGF